MHIWRSILKFSKNDLSHGWIPALVLFILGIALRIFTTNEDIIKSHYFAAFFSLIIIQAIYEHWQLNNLEEVKKHGGYKAAKQNSVKDWIMLALGIFIGSLLFGIVLNV